MTQLPKINYTTPKPEDITIYNPKVIARIKLCGGAVTINIDEAMAWKNQLMSRLKIYTIYSALMLKY